MNTRKTVYNKLFKEETQLAKHEVELGIKEEMAKIQQMANQLESQGKELFKNEQKAVVMLKEAYKLLQPIGNFQESQIESIIADLKSAVFTRAQYIDTASFIGTKNMNNAINFKTEGEHYKDWENDWGYGGAKTNKKRFRNKKTNKRRFRNKKTNKRRFRNKKLKKRYSIVNK